MLFRQLLDPETATFSYLLADEATREAVLIDSVREQFERDVTLLRELSLELRVALETHVHADHVTASGRLREALGAKVVVPAAAGVENADRQLADGDTLRFGAHALEARATPGHTEGCMSYVCHEAGVAFTGDALLIRGCGRTDFQGGSAPSLYASIHRAILSLPDETVLYPGHDYRGRMLTTVAEERAFNARLGAGKSEPEFVAIMDGLELAYPKRMDEAVPANLRSGLVPPATLATGERSVSGVLEAQGRQDAAALTHGAGI